MPEASELRILALERRLAGVERALQLATEEVTDILKYMRMMEEIAAAAADCITDDRDVPGATDGVSFKMGGHRRIRLADALKALKS